MSTFTLSSVTTSHEMLPPRTVFYGPHGIGKTTVATSAPSPIVIRTEDGLGKLRHIPAFPIATSYQNIIEALTALYKEEHQYKTVILDSLDWLEPLVQEYTAISGGKTSIEDFGFGKGYKFADEHWSRLLSGFNALREKKGMTIILIAHAHIKRFDSPETESYDRYQIKLHDRASALVQEWADVVGFANYEVYTTSTSVGSEKKTTRGASSGDRLLYVEERPAYTAKNRYSMPPKIPFSWPAFVNAISPAYAQPATDSSTASVPATDASPVATAETSTESLAQ